jgi:hypothetical protein
MNAVVERREQPAAVTSEASLMAVIQRAATDPNTDVDKMERLLAMVERVKAHDAEKEFATALNRVQKGVGTIGADASNPQTRSKYASYEKLDRVLRPLYTAEGFSLQFGTTATESPDVVRVTCTVTHSGGHSRTVSIDMPSDGKGAKGGDVMTKTHATGSAISYGMRYLLKMIFNVAVGEHDDDGNSGGGTVYISAQQAADLEAKASEVGADLPKFLKYMGAESFALIPAAHHQKALAALKAKEQQK